MSTDLTLLNWVVPAWVGLSLGGAATAVAYRLGRRSVSDPCRDCPARGWCPREAVAKLLLSLFTADELRVWVAQDPRDPDLHLSLPGAAVSPARLAHEVTVQYEQRGLIDDEFFVRLTQARPHRVRAIVLVRARWTDGLRALDRAPG